MKSNSTSIVNFIGLISLLLGVFLTFAAIKTDLDTFNTNKADFAMQYEQSKEMIQRTVDYKNGIGTEDLTLEDLSYLATLSDSVITSYTTELESEYTIGVSGLKSQMWDNILASTGKQISLILLGIALIFVAKSLNGLHNFSSKE